MKVFVLAVAASTCCAVQMLLPKSTFELFHAVSSNCYKVLSS